MSIIFRVSPTAESVTFAAQGVDVIVKFVKKWRAFHHIEGSVNLNLKVLVTFPEVNVIARRRHGQEQLL
jgi:hypothetical protein